MRRLATPVADDALVLDQLLQSKGKNVELIRKHRAAIAADYVKYVAAHGDPWALDGIAAIGTEQERKAMIALYKSKTRALAFIPAMRDGLSGPCPMCGAEGTGTLDHYLPKARYAQFSFFSRNLIPCCARCNSKRQEAVRGSTAGERAAHPYFDYFLACRVITVTFEAPWLAPKVDLVPFAVQGQELQIIKWHIENVIKPAGAIREMFHWWGRYHNDPRLLIGDSKDVLEARTRVNEQRVFLEGSSGSMNGWHSTFLHGLGLSDGMLAELLRVRAAQP